MSRQVIEPSDRADGLRNFRKTAPSQRARIGRGKSRGEKEQVWCEE